MVDLVFPEAETALVNDAFIPCLRGEPYSVMSSLGAISLSVAGFFISLLERSMSKDSNFPRLLLLDSPLSHLGRDPQDSGFRDQEMVELFYKHIRKLKAAYGDDFQLILIDNKVPASAKDLVTLEFSGSSSKGRYGLIDDHFPSTLDLIQNSVSDVEAET